ncbi:putative 2OG-Fe(II) oxygenase [Sphingomonas edaphi]|uniref:Uncharacterized protein n=1 Tax=Sphingomonas edaphi TaxID=2315689 RepID=A0A418Q336_9SPHN|nr:putative 2OG-Fe(II) oxygenase [Sphingomonas edaphi]RIX32329.1 hypothetical protein D3M59_05090 [Sphingomonas edaphi]
MQQVSDPTATYRQIVAALDTPAAGAMLNDADALVRLGPDEPRFHYVRGMILRHLDRRDEAIPSLRRAVALAPGEHLLWHGLARTLMEAGLPSVEEYGRALQLRPGDGPMIEGMTAALVAKGDAEAALRGLEQIVRRSPTWADGQKLLAQMRWMSGEREGFDRGFDEALRQHPRDYGLRYEQILALTHADQWEKLRIVVERGRAAMGELPLFAVNEAVALSELGETEAAEQMFERFDDSADSSVAVRHIRNLLRLGRLDVANAVLEPWLKGDHAQTFWPYAATIWRMTDDPRWDWLEGDERFVGVYDIAGRLPALDVLAEKLRSLHRAPGQLVDQSVRGGTQTDGNLFHLIDPVIVQLRETIREVVAEHVAQLPPTDPGHPLLRTARSPIQFSGAWSVRLTAGGHHSNHVHPMGWLSSALYIVVPPSVAGDAQAGWLNLGEPHAQLGLDLPPFRMVEPKPGRLALFPSTMWHGTSKFPAGERMTVAFDVAMPSGSAS